MGDVEQLNRFVDGLRQSNLALCHKLVCGQKELAQLNKAILRKNRRLERGRISIDELRKDSARLDKLLELGVFVDGELRGCGMGQILLESREQIDEVRGRADADGGMTRRFSV